MYREHAPPPSLAGLVECLWTRRARILAADVRPVRILPDGCSDVIFDLGGQAAGGDAGNPWPPAFVVGTMRTARVVRLGGSVELLGVRFRPGGATALLGVPADELTDRRVALDEVTAGLRGTRERLAETARERRAEVLAGQLESLRRTRRDVDPRVERAVALVTRSAGSMSVERLAGAVNLSRRQLERLFQREVGHGPKEACRVARFREATRRIHGDPSLPLARLALDVGYYDQPHLTREFGRLAGVTPGEYLRERIRLSR